MNPIDNDNVQSKFKTLLNIVPPAVLSRTLRRLLVGYIIANENEFKLSWIEMEGYIYLTYLFDLLDAIEDANKPDTKDDP
jgi:hypothetical protein